jgi:hypothetical protein
LLNHKKEEKLAMSKDQATTTEQVKESTGLQSEEALSEEELLVQNDVLAAGLEEAHLASLT